MRGATLASGLVMRAYRPSDAAALLTSVNTDRDRLAQWMPWVPHSTSKVSFESFIKRALLAEEDGLAFHRGIFDGDAIAGACGSNVDLVNREAEIGYWLGSAFEGRGVITEAVGKFLEFLFDDYEVHRVIIRAAVENTRSRAVAERHRFTLEGIQRESLILNEVPTDAAIYSMLEQEWRTRPRS